MIYLEVQWIHDFVDEPIFIYSELDNERNEIRKVEIYKNRKKGFASNNTFVNGSHLSETPIPTLEEINKDQQFIASEISRQRFEEIWNNRMR